jgi:hypothetical protein
VIALKLGDGGLRHSLHRVASEILFLPLTSARRDRWKIAIDALGQRGGQALAASIAFVLVELGAGSRSLAAGAAVIALAWIAALIAARRAYIAQFRDMLQAGEIRRDLGIPTLDADSVVMLSEALASTDKVEALAALDLLSRRGRVPALVFYHPHEAVVRHALSLLDGELPSDVTRVLEHVLGHSDARVRAAALAASHRTGPDHERLVRALDDDAVEVRAVALVALAGRGDIEVEREIATLVAGSPRDRAALVDAIAYALPGRAPRDDATRARDRGVLHQLVGAGDPVVERRALRVLARDPELADVVRLLGKLVDPATREDVRRVFLAIGQAALEALIAALDDPATPLAVRRHLPRTISRFRSREAAAALVRRLPHEPDRGTEFKLLRALGKLRADEPRMPIDAGPLREYLRRVVRDAARYAVLADHVELAHPRGSSLDLIREILGEKRRMALEYAFRTLGILFPRAGLRSAHDALERDDEGRRGAAHEIVETVAPADVRNALLAVIEDLAPADRRRQLGELAPGPFASEQELVTALLADPSESLRCVVAHHVAERHLTEVRDVLVKLRPVQGEPLVVHAFDQAIGALR